MEIGKLPISKVQTSTNERTSVPGQLQWVHCKLKPTNDTIYRSYIEGHQFCEYEDDSSGQFHIDSRAWCFQERCLSSRSIYLAAKGMNLECREGIACEHDINIGGQTRTESFLALKRSTWTCYHAGETLRRPTILLRFEDSGNP